MQFNRPPRLQTPLPIETVKIPAPPSSSSKRGAAGWLTTLLPLAAVLITVVLMVSIAGTSSSSLGYLVFLPLMLITYVVAGITMWQQSKEQKQTLIKNRAEYALQLGETQKHLLSLQQKQQKIMRGVNPSLLDCYQRIQSQAKNLGERRPEDKDFLDLRLGTGLLDPSYKIEKPDLGEPSAEYESEREAARKLYETFSIVPEVPIVARLGIVGSVGIAGQAEDVRCLTRAMLCQLLTHHWLHEVHLAAAPLSTKGEWDWLNSLPQSEPELQSKASKDEDENPLETWMAALEKELSRRQKLVAAAGIVKKDAAQTQAPLPRLVIVFDGLEPSFIHPALSLMLSKGKQLGVYGIFLTHDPQNVPGQCGAIVEVVNEEVVYSESGPEGYRQKGQPDKLELSRVQAFATALRTIPWPKSEDALQLPDVISLLDIFGYKNVDDLPLEEWWDSESPYQYMRAPIGKTSATGEFIFDLNDQDGSHGPHGLLGGMTGSGKSEVLKTLIIALAATHHPYDLNFALIDFKGGAAFNELTRLPHTVGIVTDIESHATYAERVILALTGEIERRKRILEEARSVFKFGRSHVDDYRGLPVKRPMPRLVIIFDEFAEFKTRNPEESKRLILIARQGRSLGVHLILATQNIQAAIDPEILQNSTFRICLRVADPQDSMQMVGIPDAVNIKRGQAFFGVANTNQMLQVAYTGSTYLADGKTSPSFQDKVVKVLPNGRQEILSVAKQQELTEVERASALPTELNALINKIIATSEKLHLKKPAKIWPDPLPERIYLPDVMKEILSGGWDGQKWHPCRLWGAASPVMEDVFPILGLYDQPVKQRQAALRIDAKQAGGNLLVFGSAGMGKSTLLRTLVMSLTFTHTPEDVWFYVLDYGGQSALKVLEPLPHVGAVVTRFETERTIRLIRYISAEASRRNEMLHKANVDNWMDYNDEMAAGEKIPALYFIIDNFRDFKRAFADDTDILNEISTLVSGGESARIYLVISTYLAGEVPSDLYANINSRLTFYQADPMEYYQAVGQPSEMKLLEDATRLPPPGRGLVRGRPPLEFQTALPTLGKTDKEQIDELARLAGSMAQAWNVSSPDPLKPHPIRTLTYQVSQREIQGEGSVLPENRKSYYAFIGRDYDTLLPTGFSLDEDGPSFLVIGVSPQVGKTNLLKTWIVGLTDQYGRDQLQITLVDFHSSSMNVFAGLPQVCHYVGLQSDLDGVLDTLGGEIRQRQEAFQTAFREAPTAFSKTAFLSKYPRIVTVVDDYDSFALEADENTRRKLGDLLRNGAKLGFSFVAAGNNQELPKDFEDTFLAQARKNATGVQLGRADELDQFNYAKLPQHQPKATGEPGRGYIIRRGKAALFQAAICREEEGLQATPS